MKSMSVNVWQERGTIPTKKILLLVFLLLFTGLFTAKAQHSLSLAGEWQLKLDPENVGEKENWAMQQFKDKIKLPSTTDESGYGEKSTNAETGYLTRAYKYIGAVWYNREITIPEDWRGKAVELFLERVLWQSKVYINGKLLDTNDALSTPHLHQLGVLGTGKFLLSVRVNNGLIYNIGDKGHMYTDHMQTIWNGIVGAIEIRQKEKLSLSAIKTFPDVDNNKLGVTLKFDNASEVKSAQVSYKLINLQNQKVVFSKSETIKIGIDEYAKSLSINSPVMHWDEFHPNLYRLVVEVKSGKLSDKETVDFGFRKVTHNSSKFLVNNQPIFIRGNLDCLNFPITGYPPCDVNYWKRIFKIYQQHGLNYVHFHSGCPPEAAFTAADELGLYIGVEVVWIDWWMTSTPADRPDMFTKGLPKGLGYNPSADEYVQAELKRIVDTYGNHPSFLTLSVGNELGNSNFEVMQTWIKKIKESDSRRLYSVSSARKVTPVDDYYDTHNLSGVGSTLDVKVPLTNWDLEGVYSKSGIPVLAHEVGQIPVYPRWTEINKYTGVLKAKNLESFKLLAERNGIADQEEDFCLASGGLQRINYKASLEAFFRTPSCAGYNLLGMQDYPGEGEALVGWLDPFYERKGTTSPEQFKQYSNTTVPLLRMDKVTFTNAESLTALIQLAHYGEGTLNAVPYVKIINKDHRVLFEKHFGNTGFNRGTITDIGNLKYNLSALTDAQRLRVEIGLKGTVFRNEWDIWVYPSQVKKTVPKNVYITDQYDHNCAEILKKGGNVLLFAGNLGNDSTRVLNTFDPVFWSYTFFPGQGSTTLGILLKDKHPAFKYFPTENFTNWQWESICKKKVSEFYLNDFPKMYKPIAQPVDDFHRSNKLGALFELKSGTGKLLVCGFNLSDTTDIAAMQLRHSLISYVSSEDFNPEFGATDAKLRSMFPKIIVAENHPIPPGFENSILYVDCAANLEELNKNQKWTKSKDKILVQKKTDYTVTTEGVWKDKYGQAWFGKEIELAIKCPQGVIGAVYVHFADWNGQGREGVINFEGREFQLTAASKKGQWIKLFMMREDSNDGRLLLRSTVKKGGNLMIDKVAIVLEKP